MFTVQAPPKPTLQYIGIVGRLRYNNDTAYFTETGKPTPFTHRLNDIVGGRFRLVDISPAQVIFEDISLGFRHTIPISKATTAVGTGSGSGPGGMPPRPTEFPPGFDPGLIRNNPNPPGIPANVQPYIPPNQQKIQRDEKKADVDDDGDG